MRGGFIITPHNQNTEKLGCQRSLLWWVCFSWQGLLPRLDNWNNKVANMKGIFFCGRDLRNPTGKWEVSCDMTSMFLRADSFNQQH